jgi:hexosaminidase
MIMKRLISLFLIISVLVHYSCTKKNNNFEPISIIPQPIMVEPTGGTFNLNANTKLVFPEDESIRQVAGLLSEWIKRPTGFDLSTGEMGSRKNVIQLELAGNNELGTEGYEMEVTNKKILIRANGSNGLFYGVQSLLQLLPVEIFSNKKENGITWDVPCCRITDKPRFQWRGMHLDVSRHFFPVEFIKRYIDLIAMHKMNVFHWHLTDDNGWRIEIKKYPLLTEVAAWRVNREDMPWREVTPPQPGEKATYGGFYTQDEIREVVRYASERFITVVPEIEMPGHSCEVFAAYPELSCRGAKLYVQPGSYWPNEDIFCAGKEETFEFIENVLLEVMDLFPSEYIHVGGDEANKARWKECEFCQQRIKDEKLADVEELQSYFIRRVELFLNYHSKKLIGWDEILEGGLAPEATVMSWRGFNGGMEAAEQGHNVIMCPTSYCYFDYYQANPDFEPEAIGGFLSLKKVYSFEPVPEGLAPDKIKYILGAQGNVWTEFITTPKQAEYMALPRMTALSEVVWSTAENKNWDGFRERMKNQFKRFDLMKVNYSKGSWNVDILPSMDNGIFKVILESEQPDYPVHFTTDGSDPTDKSTVYKEPLQINQSAMIKAGIFVDGKLKEYSTNKELIFHKGLGKTGKLTEQPSKNYYANGVLSLTDGLKGSNNFRDGYWLGFEGNDMDFELDLGREIPITSVQVSFFQNTGSWIFMPLKVQFVVYNNDHNQIAVAERIPETTIEAKGTVIEDISYAFENIKGRFIKVHAVNMKTCPEWHEGAGSKAWIFTDEVVVE